MPRKTRTRIGVNLLFVRPGLNGGTETYARDMTTHLIKASESTSEIVIYASSSKLLSWFAEFPNVQFRAIDGLSKRVWLRIIYEQLFFSRVLERDEIDVLFSPGYVSPLWGKYLSIITIHDMFAFVCPQFISRPRSIYWRAMLPLSMNRANAVIAVSDTTANDIVRFFPDVRDKIKVIKESVSTEVEKSFRRAKSQKPSRPPASPYILAVSTIKPIKNISKLVEAFALILQKCHVDLDLVLVGRDALGTIRDQAKRLGLDEKVILTGYVSDEELYDYYASASVFVLPSFYEGFGLPILEAMYCGCPVACSSAPALKEVGGDAAVYFDPNSTADMARAILDGIEQRQELVRKGYLNLEKYSWMRGAEDLSKVIQQLQRCV